METSKLNLRDTIIEGLPVRRWAVFALLSGLLLAAGASLWDWILHWLEEGTHYLMGFASVDSHLPMSAFLLLVVLILVLAVVAFLRSKTKAT